MAKTKIEKELEKNRKTTEKAAREARIRQIAESIVRTQPVVYGVQIIDPDAEAFLDAILDQYDGNENNQVNFSTDGIGKSLEDSSAVQYEKLKMYGVVSSTIIHWDGAIITLSDTAKTYKTRKEAALQKEKEENERKAKLETDYIKIQSMSIEQLREIYLQAVLANDSLQKSLDIQENQLQVLKDLFSSEEDETEIQKEILQILLEQERDKHPIRDFLTDKGGDLGIEALKISIPLAINALKTLLIHHGLL